MSISLLNAKCPVLKETYPTGQILVTGQPEIQKPGSVF